MNTDSPNCPHPRANHFPPNRPVVRRGARRRRSHVSFQRACRGQVSGSAGASCRLMASRSGGRAGRSFRAKSIVVNGSPRAAKNTPIGGAPFRRMRNGVRSARPRHLNRARARNRARSCPARRSGSPAPSKPRADDSAIRPGRSIVGAQHRWQLARLVGVGDPLRDRRLAKGHAVEEARAQTT